MFPTAHSVVYRTEAGEVLGWDNPSYSDEPYDPDDYLNWDDSDDEDEEDDLDNEPEWNGSPNSPQF